jgi:hypothetical protein
MALKFIVQPPGSQMSIVRVRFHGCIQDSQEYGSDDEHMISRVFFDMEVDGQGYEGLHVDIKQAVGSSYETGPMEVDSPKGTKYRGPFDHQAFSEAVEKYYRDLVGSKASASRRGRGSQNIRMPNRRFGVEQVVEFEVSGPDISW